MTLEQFHFKGNDGKDYTLPKQLKAGILRKARQAKDELDYVFTVFELVCADMDKTKKGSGERTLAALDDLDTNQLEEVSTAWLQGLAPEKSSGSSS